MIGTISVGTLAVRGARAIGRGLLTRWYLMPIVLLGLWAMRLDHLRADARRDLATEQAGRRADAAAARAATAAAERRYADRQVQAATTYADRLAAREPIIIRSTDTVRQYAQTDAGRARCLSPDRVRDIDSLDRDLADDPAAAGSGDGAVQPSADAAPG